MMKVLLTIIAIIGMIVLAAVLGIIMGLGHIIIHSYNKAKKENENKLD